MLAPGFVDSHTHLYGVLAHGIPLQQAPSGFMPFLEDFWWPLVEDRLDRQMICEATRYNCNAMIHSGITSFYDCTEAPYAIPGILNSQAEVVQAAGLRGILSFEATQRVSHENGLLGLKENAGFIQNSYSSSPLPLSSPPLPPGEGPGVRVFPHSLPPGVRVSGMMCFHTSFTCDADLIRAAYQLAQERSGLVHCHCSEGSYEPAYALKTWGLRPVAYYHHLGVLGPRSLLSQCVQLSPEEIELLARSGARVTHMPLSNCEVGGGIAPVPDLLSAGVTVGLGSDGYITDFFEVMRGAFLIHKAHRQDPRVMPAAQVWYLATEGGARAIGLENIGRLAPGWQADLQLIKVDFPTPLTESNLYDQTLLYCHPSDVEAVMVAGQVLMRDGVIAGEDSALLREHTRAAARRLWER